MLHSIPIIEIALTLLIGATCSVLSPNIARILSLLSLTMNGILSTILILYSKHDTIFYHMGNWSPPYGIEIRIDSLNIIMSLLINSIGILSVISHFNSMETEISKNKINFGFAFLLCCIAGLLGIVFSNDLFNIYVFIEISSISSYILSTLHKSGKSLISSFQYLITGSIGATFYLLGIGFILAATGSLNISHIQKILSETIQYQKQVQIGVLFMISGILMKAGFFPFHQWMVRTYSSVPSFISVFFSGTTSKVMLYIITEIISLLLPTHTFTNHILIILLVSCCIVIPAILALLENEPKKILAYSSISQMGYILSALCGQQDVAIKTIGFAIVSHSIAKSTLFTLTSSNIKYFNQIILIICLASLVGIPPTAGFFAKLLLLKSSLSSSVILTTSIVLGSVLSIFYCHKLLGLMNQQSSQEPQEKKWYYSISLYPAIACACCLLVLGFIV